MHLELCEQKEFCSLVSVQILLPLLLYMALLSPGPNWALKVVGGQPYSHGALVLFWGCGDFCVPPNLPLFPPPGWSDLCITCLHWFISLLQQAQLGLMLDGDWQ